MDEKDRIENRILFPNIITDIYKDKIDHIIEITIK